MKSKGMTEYTEWAIAHIWHVSDEPYPSDSKGNCACECEYCKKGKHLATRRVHFKEIK